MASLFPPMCPSLLLALSQEIDTLRAALQHARAQREAEVSSRPFWRQWLPSAAKTHLKSMESQVATVSAGLSARIRTGLLAGVDEMVHTSFTPEQLLAWKKQDGVVLRATVELRTGESLAQASSKASRALLHTVAMCQEQIDFAKVHIIPAGTEAVDASLEATLKLLHAFAHELPEDQGIDVASSLKRSAQGWATGFPAFDTLEEVQAHCQAIGSQITPVMVQLQAHAGDLREAYREALAGKAVMEASVFVRVQDAMPALLVACECNPDEFWKQPCQTRAPTASLQGLGAR